jgi:hypothetical protein
MNDDRTFADFAKDAEKYSDEGDWDRCKQAFVKLDLNARIETLKLWDGLFEHEIRPTRELGQRITQYREISDLHRLLQRNGR